MLIRLRTERHFDKQKLRGNPYLVANKSGKSTTTRPIQNARHRLGATLLNSPMIY